MYLTVFTGLGKLGTYHITSFDNHQTVINPAGEFKDRL